MHPMVEATAEVSTPLIWLSEAVALLAKAYGSTSIAQRVLLKGLCEKRVRWTCHLLEGDPTGWDLPTSEPARSGKFWENPKVDCLGNSARAIVYRISFVGDPAPRPPEVCMIKVVEEDVRAVLLPSQAPTAAIAPTEIERPEGPQADRVLRVLPELYPPHGVVPPG